MSSFDQQSTSQIGQPAIPLSYAETLFVQAFKELVYAYPAQYIPVPKKEVRTASTEVVEDLPEYQHLVHILNCSGVACTPSVCALFGLVKSLCEDNTVGNFVEYGAACSLSTIILAYAIKTYSRTPRLLYIIPSRANYSFAYSLNEDAEAVFSEPLVQRIAAQLGIQNILLTTRPEYQDIVAHMPSMLGMIALLHYSGSQEHFIEALTQLKPQLTDGALLLLSGNLSQAEHNATAKDISALFGKSFPYQVVAEKVGWCQVRDALQINPTLPPQAIEHFVSDEQTLTGIVSQMSVNERFQLHFLLSRTDFNAATPLRFVEIGSYSGYSLLLSYLALKRQRPVVQAFAIEPQGTEQFYYLLQKYSEEIVHLKTTSDLAAPLLREQFEREQNWPSFIFIDGYHRYRQVKQDIQFYLPLLAQNGLIVFHDYLPTLDEKNRQAILTHHAGKEVGIKQACEELIEGTGQYQLITLPLLYPDDLTQSQAYLPIIPNVRSTLRVYRKIA